MENDPFLIRFLGLLSLFTFFMLILLSSSNLIQLFLGWEGIGICSYFLIGFWYTRVQANKAALKALIVNRIGDIALLLGLSLCVYVFRSTDFSVVFSLAPLYTDTTVFFCNINFNLIELLCFFFLIAAVGKSAQIGLHT
jgi:NADH:ubiquinone oxidoreductase subunit 5 (subunit L)/multisubunit Na+/H+ antiporter MnhA subunit